MGVIGLFIGPVILAVAHTLFKSWVKEGAGEGSVEKKGETAVAKVPQGGQSVGS
jgi:predicted PurR-regulated permease PerM